MHKGLATTMRTFLADDRVSSAALCARGLRDRGICDNTRVLTTGSLRKLKECSSKERCKGMQKLLNRKGARKSQSTVDPCATICSHHAEKRDKLCSSFLIVTR